MNALTTDPIDDEAAAAQGRIAVAAAFAALGSEPRLAIVLRLVRAGRRGMATGDLGEAVGVTGSVLTHHLKHLYAAGLVDQEKDGRRIIWFADHDQISALSQFLMAECCLDETMERHHG